MKIRDENCVHMWIRCFIAQDKEMREKNKQNFEWNKWLNANVYAAQHTRTRARTYCIKHVECVRRAMCANAAISMQTNDKNPYFNSEKWIQINLRCDAHEPHTLVAHVTIWHQVNKYKFRLYGGGMERK